MKNPMASSGIEPATFRFVAQHLNYGATARASNGADLPFIHSIDNIFSRDCYWAYLGLENEKRNENIFGAMRQLFVDFRKACSSFRRDVYVVYIVI